MSADPFGTEALRESVLAAWRGSPTRFREDANAEEDLRLGGYRDRLLVELAQNASDAAGDVPGVLRLSLVDGELRAANTGAPLDAAGVAALASLRASSKAAGSARSAGGTSATPARASATAASIADAVSAAPTVDPLLRGGAAWASGTGVTRTSAGTGAAVTSTGAGCRQRCVSWSGPARTTPVFAHRCRSPTTSSPRATPPGWPTGWCVRACATSSSTRLPRRSSSR